MIHDSLSVGLKFTNVCLYIFLYNSESIDPTMMARCPGPWLIKQAQIIMLPPPTFTDGIRFFLLECSVSLSLNITPVI